MLVMRSPAVVFAWAYRAAFALALAAAVLVWQRTSTTAEAEAPLLWLSYNDPDLETAASMWLQVQSGGHAWFELRSAAGSDESMRAITTFEVAFQVTPSDYARLREELDSLGVRRGQFAWNHRAAAGLGTPPATPTHELEDSAVPGVVAALDLTLRSRGIAAREVHAGLQQVLRAAGKACMLQASGRVGMLVTRSSDGRFKQTDLEGPACLRDRLSSALLGRSWSAPVVHVRVTSELDAVAAGVRLTFAPDTPLLANDLALEQVAHAASSQTTSSRPGMVSLEGKWREVAVQLRRASDSADKAAVVEVVNQTVLDFPHGIWGDRIAIEARVTKEGSLVTAGQLELRKDKLIRCRGIRDCAQLTPGVIRGLAAAAYGQRREISQSAIKAANVRSSSFIRVALGRDVCTVSLTGKCLFANGYEGRPGLHALLSRLSDASEELLHRERRLGFEVCDPFR